MCHLRTKMPPPKLLVPQSKIRRYNNKVDTTKVLMREVMSLIRSPPHDAAKTLNSAAKRALLTLVELPSVQSRKPLHSPNCKYGSFIQFSLPSRRHMVRHAPQILRGCPSERPERQRHPNKRLSRGCGVIDHALR